MSDTACLQMFHVLTLETCWKTKGTSYQEQKERSMWSSTRSLILKFNLILQNLSNAIFRFLLPKQGKYMLEVNYAQLPLEWKPKLHSRSEINFFTKLHQGEQWFHQVSEKRNIISKRHDWNTSLKQMFIQIQRHIIELTSYSKLVEEHC